MTVIISIIPVIAGAMARKAVRKEIGKVEVENAEAEVGIDGAEVGIDGAEVGTDGAEVEAEEAKVESGGDEAEVENVMEEAKAGVIVRNGGKDIRVENMTDGEDHDLRAISFFYLF